MAGQSSLRLQKKGLKNSLEEHNKIPLIVVVGPTASGKTDLSIQIAKRFQGEIVSADSMQIYKGMDIATAKPTKEEQQGIPHHLMDFLDPRQPFSVSDYVQLANQAIDGILARGNQPVLVGGTGLYVDSLVENITFTETETDQQYRKQLQQLAEEQGGEYLLRQLEQIDPEYAKTLHPNNCNRIIRGLEIYHTTGVPMTQHLQNSRLHPSRFHPCYIGLNYQDRQHLYDRINLRVDLMMEQGLLQEAKAVYDTPGLKTAYQAIGYKELSRYFSGEESLEQALETIKQQTRRYAKRQLTWFRRNPNIHWIFPDSVETIQTIYEQSFEIIEKSLYL
ncbi:tRNA (adenosine(37)-N6)-dimethylallyltransferase MiaA [Clostridium sp. NSJ-27]|uniref:tRNA dimethylallyltransferase n=2 Tax=Eubacteriales TaxID=186802 RepID=A0ABR7IQ14_9CLOT|nr:tRNA (adenosine(37)-N6)-dimethylallyltransferase MiaA [Clostridium facile]